IERLREFRKVFDAHLAGYPPNQPIRVGTQRPVYVTDNEADARAVAGQARRNMRLTLSLRHNYQRVECVKAVPAAFSNEASTDDTLEKFSGIGTSYTYIRQLRPLHDAMPIDQFNCSFWFGDLTQDHVLRSMRLFSQEVMPAFR